MNIEDFTPLGELTKTFVKPVKVSINEPGCSNTGKKEPKKNEKETKGSLLRRFPSFRSALRPDMQKLRSSLRKVNCFKSECEDEVPLANVPRHKSIDIGVGLARRVSLFIFTKRSVNVHPYHPYVPEQTTRKIYILQDDK